MPAEERIRPQPSISDPQERAIRELLTDEFSTEFAKREIERLRVEQLHFLARSAHNIMAGRSQDVRPDYELLLPILVPKMSIKFGSEYLKELPKFGFIVATNHLAMPKATRFNRSDLGKEIENPSSLQQLPEEVEPFPIRLAAVAATIGQEFRPHEIAIELARPYGDIQRAAGVVTLSETMGGRFQHMEEQTTNLFSVEPSSYVITYPESGTTGKRGGGGLYGVNQEEFHSGFLRLAQSLTKHMGRPIPIIVIGQSFHPDEGFRSGVLKPIRVEEIMSDEAIELKKITVQKELSELVNKLRYGE